MLKTVTVLAFAAAALAPMSASAAGLKSKHATPSAQHQGQWWTNASGCTYSRAGRPGEIVWFLSGKPPRGASCPEFIFQKKIDGGYSREPFMING